MANVDDERIRSILAGRRAIRRVAFPGDPDLEIGIRLLRDSEIDDCRFAAVAYLEAKCRKAGISLVDFMAVDPDELDREHQRQVIWRATYDVESFEGSDFDKARPFFPSDRQVRELDSATVAVLWGLYVDLLDAVDPRIRLTEEQVKEIADALGKAPSEPAILAGFAPATLASLARTMAARLAT